MFGLRNPANAVIDLNKMSERNPQNMAGTQHWIRFMVVAP